MPVVGDYIYDETSGDVEGYFEEDPSEIEGIDEHGMPIYAMRFVRGRRPEAPGRRPRLPIQLESKLHSDAVDRKIDKEIDDYYDRAAARHEWMLDAIRLKQEVEGRTPSPVVKYTDLAYVEPIVSKSRVTPLRDMYRRDVNKVLNWRKRKSRVDVSSYKRRK